MTNTQKRESMVFYSSFYDAVEDLPAEQFKETLCNIFKYALCGETPQVSGVAKAVFVLVKPQIDKNNQRYENAKKSHTPKSVDNQNAENKALSKPQEAEKTPSAKHTPKKTKDNIPFHESKEPAAAIQENPSFDEPRVLDFIPDGDVIISSDSFCDSSAVNKSESVLTKKTAGAGEYENVFLTAVERADLLLELGMDEYLERVDFLSRYIKRKPGYNSACHYEDLRGWVKAAVSKPRPPKKEEKNDGLCGLTFDNIFEKP